jgi:hypothetical protein
LPRFQPFWVIQNRNIFLVSFRLNNEVCQRIRREAARLPSKWLPGQFVALLQGKIVARSVDPEEVFRALDQLEPDDRRGMVFQIGADYDHIQEL